MHLIIYNQRSYDFFVDFDENKNIPIDNIWQDKFMAIVPVPFLATQYNDFSNIENVNKDHSKIIKSNKRLIRYVSCTNIPIKNV